MQPTGDAVTERDDDLHEHGRIAGWRERLTFAFFDAAAGFGGIARMTIHPADAKAEATVNVFLPDRSLATVLIKGPFDRAGGVGRLSMPIDEPVKVARLVCRDTAIVLHGVGPGGLPSGKERSGSAAKIELDLRFDAWIPPVGRTERSRLVDEMNFVQVVSNGRFEQAGRVAGTVRVGGHQGTIDAGGIRERAWGWGADAHGSSSYWIAVAFAPTRAVSLHGATIDQQEHHAGWVATAAGVRSTDDIAVTREREGRTIRRASATVDGHVMEADVRATIPIRDGGARVQQSLIEARLAGATAWGLAEFAEQA